MSIQSTSLIFLLKVLAIFGLFFLAILLSPDRLQAASIGFSFDHDCAMAPAVCGLPIGQLDFAVDTPASVTPGSLVPISFSGVAVEALGSVPICPAIRYGANGMGSLSGYLPIPGDVGNCFTKNAFLTTAPMYFTASAVEGPYSFCAQGGTSNAEYREQNGAQCDTYQVVALPTGTINVTSNNPAASWNISGPSGFLPPGSGTSASYTNQPIGQYTIFWDTISGQNTPGSTTFNLTAGGTLSFPPGNYTPIVAPSVNLNFI